MGEMTKDASQEVIITQGTYLASAVCKEQYPEVPRKEIVFIGRSNVGKSSLINSLTRVKNLARVSSQPGKTQTINFYEIGAKLPQVEERQDFYLVDLPDQQGMVSGGLAWLWLCQDWGKATQNLEQVY